MQEPPAGLLHRVRAVPFALSLLLCAFLAVCYATRGDWCAAVTIFPVWVWLAPAIVLAGASWGSARLWTRMVAIPLWLAFLLALAEEPRSLLRGGEWPNRAWQTARADGQALRVVSLNCAGGSEAAAREVVRCEPDIVLLQESPRKEIVERLARELYGREASVLWGMDASIVARGSIVPTPRRGIPPRLRGTASQARVRLRSGLAVEVVCLRLLPPLVRTDLWAPECWAAQTENRRARRADLAGIARGFEAVEDGIPLLVGGDFNAPAGDAVFRLLRPRLRDTLAQGGRRWGNTAINDFPFARIDQVWASDHFRSACVVARKTRHSDHRMVICDLILTGHR